MCEAGYQLFTNRIAHEEAEDGDGSWSRLSGTGGNSACGNDHVDLETQEFSGEAQQPLRLLFSRSGRDDDALPLLLAVLAQALAERIEQLLGRRGFQVSKY